PPRARSHPGPRTRGRPTPCWARWSPGPPPSGPCAQRPEFAGWPARPALDGRSREIARFAKSPGPPAVRHLRSPMSAFLQATPLLVEDDLQVHDVRCSAGPGDAARPEVHSAFVLAYVRSGSFGVRTEQAAHQLVPGGFMTGAPGDVFACSHEHGQGDQCLSFHLSPALVDTLAGERTPEWHTGGRPPEPELGMLAALATAAAEGGTDVSLEEAAFLLVDRFLARGGAARPAWAPRVVDRRRAVDIALWVEANADQPMQLATLARRSGLRPAHL